MTGEGRPPFPSSNLHNAIVLAVKGEGFARATHRRAPDCSGRLQQDSIYEGKGGNRKGGPYRTLLAPFGAEA